MRAWPARRGADIPKITGPPARGRRHPSLLFMARSQTETGRGDETERATTSAAPRRQTYRARQPAATANGRRRGFRRGGGRARRTSARGSEDCQPENTVRAGSPDTGVRSLKHQGRGWERALTWRAVGAMSSVFVGVGACAAKHQNLLVAAMHFWRHAHTRFLHLFGAQGDGFVKIWRRTVVRGKATTQLTTTERA